MKKSILITLMLLTKSISFAQGGWIQKANATTSNRMGSFGFTIGSKVYIGGGDDNSSVYLNDFWEYDPATNVWTQKANYSSTGRRFGVGFSIGSKGYTGLGEASATLGYSFADFYEYNPSTKTWTQKTSFPDGGRSRAVGTSSSTMGYVSTGTSFNLNLKNDIWEYNPLNNTWTQKAPLTNGKRRCATGFSVNDMIFIGCGIDTANNLNDLWMYNPFNNTWTQRANFPGIGRSFPTGFSIGNYGFIGGGSSASPSSALSDFYKYNTSSNIWSAIPNFPVVISSGFGTSLNGRGYVGTGSSTDRRTNLFYEFDTLCGLSFTFSKLDIQCNGANNGLISITAKGGTGPYQYSIDNGVSYQSSNSFTNLAPNTYTIKVTDVNTCVSNILTSTVTQPIAISFTTTQVNVKCFGGNTGSIAVSASGGTGILQYSKDNGTTWQSSNSFLNLIANSYDIKVKDANNCISALQTISITQSQVLAFTTSQTNVICNGGNSGIIAITATGGTIPYQYSKNNGSTYQTSNVFLNLSAGSNTIVVKNSNNCISNSQTVIISEPSAIPKPTITANSPLVFCIGDSVILTSSLGNSYSWSTSATTRSMAVYNSSTVTVTIFDNLGCSSISNPVSVTANSLPPIPTITASVNTLTSSSASGNQWYFKGGKINGATNRTYTATQSGNYSVEVTNVNNCSSISPIFNFTLTGINDNFQTVNISVYPNPSNGLVFLNLGDVSISEIKVFNSLGEIIYQSNKKVSSINLSNNPKGVYFLLLTDKGQTFGKKIILH
jgi:N-acetylneuraminic acid mutarotase